MVFLLHVAEAHTHRAGRVSLEFKVAVELILLVSYQGPSLGKIAIQVKSENFSLPQKHSFPSF